MQQKNTVSDLVDNEATNTRFNLGQDDLEQWSRYHLVRDIIRQQAPQQINLSLIDSIEQALEQEPIIVAFSKRQKVKQKFQQLFQQPKTRIPLQMSLAASIAILAVINFPTTPPGNLPANDNPISVLQTAGPIAGSTTPVSFSTTSPNEVLTEKERLRQIQLEQQKINAVLADHQQQIKLRRQTNQQSNDQ